MRCQPSDGSRCRAFSSYILQVDDNPNFAAPNYQMTVPDTFTDLSQALTEGQWHWRVASISTSGTISEHSQIGELFVDFTPPDAPALTQIPSSPTAQSRPQLAWEEIADATRYRLQLSQDNVFSQASVEEYLSETEIQIQIPLASGTWYARISAIDKAGKRVRLWPGQQFCCRHNCAGVAGSSHVVPCG